MRRAERFVRDWQGLGVAARLDLVRECAGDIWARKCDEEVET